MILIILYINYFSRASELLSPVLFADDTSVLIEGQLYTCVIEILNKELKKIVIWISYIRLTLSVQSLIILNFIGQE